MHLPCQLRQKGEGWRLAAGGHKIICGRIDIVDTIQCWLSNAQHRTSSNAALFQGWIDTRLRDVGLPDRNKKLRKKTLQERDFDVPSKLTGITGKKR